MGDMTNDFSREEFACKCGCGFDDIKAHHVDRLQEVRDDVGFPMYVTSGCRCLSHNTAVGGVDHSAHMRGEASDISCLDASQRFELVSSALRNGFNRIGIAKTFIHLDKDPFLPHPRIWTYS